MSSLSTQPHPLLKPYIKQYSSSVFDIHQRKMLFPDGSFRLPDSAIRVSFHFSDTIPWMIVDGKKYTQAKQNIRGLQLKPVVFNTSQSLNVFSIEFTPAGFVQFFNLHCSELDLTAMELHASWFPEYEYVFERLSVFTHFSDQVHFLNTVFLGKLRSHPDQQKITQLYRLISMHRSTPTVKELSENTFITERSFRRFFNKHFGVSPKLYLRLCRFEKTVAAMKNETATLPLQLALELGYYDQAHFIHEFKAFSGVSPSKMNFSQA